MIEEIVSQSLCTGCGTCVSICPRGAIKIIKDEKKGVYIPTVETNECNKCDLCVRVCPGHEMNYREISAKTYKNTSHDELIGNYVKCCVGYSKDDCIRYNSTSGGLITQLLIFALESKLIDGALVTRMKKDNPLEPEPFIAKTKEEIIEASNSKYCPVPANIAIREILKENIRCAVVGLPCHINGIRKFENVNKKLKELIILHVGIFCGYGISFLGTEILLKWMNVERSEVKNLNYRGKGWPGSLEIELKNGTRKTVPEEIYYSRFFVDCAFTPKRCMICNDLTCELSDISFGDAWLPEYKNDKKGTSVFIVRNEVGNKIIQKAKEAEKIFFLDVEINKVIQSQKSSLYFKKKNLRLRKKILGIKVKSNSIIKEEYLDLIIAGHFCISNYIFSKTIFKNVLVNSKTYMILRYYRFLWFLICSIKAKKLLKE